MKACFPVAQDRGLESCVHSHFGSAPLFLIADTESRATHVVPNPERDHAHGRCSPLDVLAGEQIDLVVVSGIGAGALHRLRDAGIAVYHTSRETAGEAMGAIGRGALPAVLPEATCAGGAGSCGGGPQGHGHGAGQGGHRCGGGGA
jgi:predicted Fe-Mo cluster-binding NifX family protein